MIWYDLGGQKYGGVVKYNLHKFIQILYSSSQNTNKT